jgi:hypothetical protein
MMRWLLPVVILLVCPAARGDGCGTTVTGKVVSVPDGGSVWVYLEQARACYHFTLSGIQAPPAEQPLGLTARDALQKMVLGREVKVTVQQLCESAATPGEVSLDGQSVNTQIARLLSPGDDSVASVAARQITPHRPLLAVCQVLRQWIAAPGYVLAGR